MALNLGVTSCQSLEISLDQFVRGEVLEGSNAYYCEKCKEKVMFSTSAEVMGCVCVSVCLACFYTCLLMSLLTEPYLSQRTTVKRTCIKSLPSVLVIHLMRFGFDWESGRSIKYDEQIRVRTTLPVPHTIFQIKQHLKGKSSVKSDSFGFEWGKCSCDFW